MSIKKTHTLFEKYLNETDSRYTPQKRQLVEDIFKMKDHFEVEDFIDTLRKKDVKFSRATVYRTIKQLLDAGLIQKISTKDGRVFYEGNPTQKQHDHLICNTCGKILEIKEPTIETYLKEFCKSIGFQPEYRSLHLYGECAECTSKK